MKTPSSVATTATAEMSVQLPRMAVACLLLVLFVFTLPSAVEAQFSFTTNDGALTVTGYVGPGGSITIPGTTNGLAVTCIGRAAFYDLTSLTNVTIPDSVTNIEADAFGYCNQLTGVNIGKSVTALGIAAFSDCWRLASVLFHGNAPSPGANVFFDDSTTVYYLPGTKGWGTAFAGRPAMLWNAQSPATNAGPTAKVGKPEPAQSHPQRADHRRPRG